MKSFLTKLCLIGFFLQACAITYYFTEWNASSQIYRADQWTVTRSTTKIEHPNTQNEININNKGKFNAKVIPINEEFLNKKPWNSFNLNILSILLNLHNNKIETALPKQYRTLPEEQIGHKIKLIKWFNKIPSYYYTCRNITMLWDYPIGIPQISVHSTNELRGIASFFHNNDYQSLPSIDFSQLIDFDALCVIHTPGFIADNTIMNLEQYYHFTYENMGSPRCWGNKSIDFLCNTAMRTCSVEGKRDNTIIIDGSLQKIVNLAFRLTGWVGDEFSHFHIFVVPQFAQIYSILLDLKNKTMDINSKYNHIFYNITIVTHVNDPVTHFHDIKPWFWKQFGLNLQKTNVVTWLMNITFAASKSWCVDAKSMHYSPLLFSPYFIRFWDNYAGNIVMKWKHLARNSMLTIKPFITNLNAQRNIVLYLPRYQSAIIRRSVQNQGKVIKALKQFVSDNNSKLNYEFSVFEISINRDDDRELLSKAAIIISPHGGALANLNLAQPGSYVIEFIDWFTETKEYEEQNKVQKFRPCYYALSQANGLHYYYLKPDNFYFDRGNMKIDIDLLLQLMNQVYDRIKRDGFSYKT